MRLIETEMNAAVWNHKDWSKDNTSVRINGSYAGIYLHGNHIATLNRFDKTLEVHAGPDDRWFSRTTFSRLNALTLQFCGRKVFYTSKRVPMIETPTGNREWRTNDFFSFNVC